MYRYIFSVWATIMILLPLFTVLPTPIAHAQLQTVPDVSSIVSCSGVVASDSLPACNWCSFVQLIGNMVQYSIYLAVMLSALMFSYAGFLFLTNNGKKDNITKAWSIFRRSLLGTVAILAAWLIVNAIMTKLAVGLGLGDNWNSITGCSEKSAGTTRSHQIRNNFGINAQAPGQQYIYLGDEYGLNAPVRNAQYSPITNDVTYNNTRLTSNADDYKLPNGITNAFGKSDARVILGQRGFDFNRGCQKANLQGTCLYGLQRASVDGATRMIQECGTSCNMEITGGTEKLDRNGNPVHASGTQGHHAGKKLDFADNAATNNYMRNTLYFTNTTRSNIRGGAESRTHKGTGAVCVKESNHWDCKY